MSNSPISPIMAAYYNIIAFGIRQAEIAKIIPQDSGSPIHSFRMDLTPASPAISGSHLLARRMVVGSFGSSLTTGQIKFNAVTSEILAQAAKPSNIALALAAPTVLVKARQWGMVAEASLASGAGVYVTKPAAVASFALALAACGGTPEGGDYTSADAGTLPPDRDVTCDNVYATINGATSDPTLASLVQSIQFPTLDVTHNGNNGIKVTANSKGDLIASFTPSNPVAWVKKDDKLFVLTANKNGDTYAPATLFVYKLNSNNTLASNEPLPTNQFNRKAIMLDGYFGPTNMSLADIKDKGKWLGITLGASSGNKVILVDPSGPFSPVYDPAIQPDYCALKDYPAGDAGSGGAGSKDGGHG